VWRQGEREACVEAGREGGVCGGRERGRRQDGNQLALRLFVFV
jgi:hypothetical protein